MAEPPSMFEEFSYTGYWRRPENPTMRWAGTLTYKPNAYAELELAAVGDGPFTEPDPKHFPQLTGRLLGELPIPPYKITLIDNFRSGQSSAMSTRLARYRYWAEHLLTGHWFPTNEDVTFKSVLVIYSSLRGWMWLGSPFWGERDGDQLTLTLGGDGLLYNCRVCSIDTMFYFHQHIGAKSDDLAHRLELDNYIRIVPESSKSLKWFRKTTNSMRNLFTFLAGFPIETKRIAGALEGAKRIPEKAEIYHRINQPEKDEVYLSKIMFSLRLLGDKVSDVLNAWFERCEEFEIPYKLCLDVIRSDRQHTLFDFLALVHALESFHRYRVHNKKLDLEVRLKYLRDNIPATLREQHSLNDAFLDSVVSTRDFHSHYDPKIKEHQNVMLTELEFYDAVTRLIPLIAFHLYRELTLSEANILEGFRWVESTEGLWQRQKLQLSPLEENL